MMVSVFWVCFAFSRFNTSAKTMAKAIMVRFVSATPSTTPMAMPVSAECPSASEKNAILLLTIMVPRMPNSGVMIRMASSAFFIKSKETQEKGSSVSIQL